MSTTSAASPSPLPVRQLRLVIGAVMLGVLLSALDQTVVSTALPQIVSDLGGLDGLPWVVTAYLLTSMVATPLWGKFSDLYGRRPTFQAAISVFLVGSLLCGMAGSIVALAAFRAVQGVGAGGLFALALSIIADLVPPRDRGRYQGLFGAVFGLASVGGPVVGGWLAAGPGWQWIFWVNLPVGVVSLVVISVVLRVRATRRGHRIDYLGASLIVLAVSALLLYLNWAAAKYGWTAPGPLALVALFLVLAVLFVVVERRAAEPIIPMRLFRNPLVATGNLFGFLAGAAMFTGVVFLPVYFQTVGRMSATRSGLAMLPIMLGIVLTTTVSGRLISRTQKYKIYPVLGAALLVVATPLLARLGPDTPYWWVGLLAFVFGAGVGLMMQTILVAVQNSVEPRDIGAATGATNFFQRMGAAIGTAVLGAVLASRLTAELTDRFGSGAAERVPAQDVAAAAALPPPVRSQVLAAYAGALDDVFLVAVPVVVLALIVSFFLRELPASAALPATSPRSSAAASGGGSA